MVSEIPSSASLEQHRCEGLKKGAGGHDKLTWHACHDGQYVQYLIIQHQVCAATYAVVDAHEPDTLSPSPLREDVDNQPRATQQDDPAERFSTSLIVAFEVYCSFASR